MKEAERLADVLRTSGRLRQEDHLTLVRALRLVLDRRADFDADPTEALVQAVATLAVMESV
jgi:hypothetical protein